MEERSSIEKEFLSEIVGGDPFTLPLSIGQNGCVFTTRALLDTGANGYLFVSMDLAEKLLRGLRVQSTSNFTPITITGYNGQGRQEAKWAIRANVQVQGRAFRDQWLLVLDMPQEVVVGRKWLEKNDVLVDVRRRCLVFNDEESSNPVLISTLR